MGASLGARTKREPGEVAYSLLIYRYWLICYLDILFFSFQSGAKCDPQKNPEVDTPPKLLWLAQCVWVPYIKEEGLRAKQMVHRI